MTEQTIRQKVLQYLIHNRTATAREVARAMQMTPANARHHLSLLAADGRIQAFSKIKAGRGRPIKLYRPSGMMSGNNLEFLLRALLEELAPEARRVLLEKIGQEKLLMVKDVGSTGEQTLIGRLATAVAALNDLHYQARWEAGSAGPRVILGYCPYEAIIESYPEVCWMDKAGLERALGVTVSQAAKLETGSGAAPYCVFEVV
jgi:predicted ArsR family transcriptional regulator